MIRGESYIRLANQTDLEVKDVDVIGKLADEPHGAISKDNVRNFDELVKRLIDCLCNYATSTKPPKGSEFLWATLARDFTDVAYTRESAHRGSQAK